MGFLVPYTGDQLAQFLVSTQLFGQREPPNFIPGLQLQKRGSGAPDPLTQEVKGLLLALNKAEVTPRAMP